MTDRLTSLDATFLNTEHATEPMHVAGLYIFDAHDARSGAAVVPDLHHLLEERLPLIERYRQRCVVVPLRLGHPVWVDDPDFDLTYHLRRAALPAPGGMPELLDFVARVHERPLDRGRPLWETYVIEGLAGDRFAVYTKVHHAMVDGISGIDLATVMFDPTPEGRTLPPPRRWHPGPLPSGPRLVADVVGEAVRGGAGGLLTALGHPVETPRRLVRAVRAAASVRQLAPMLRPVAPGPFNGPVGPHRRIALAEVSLARVKAIKNARDSTVNDVVLCLVGEAVQGYLAHRRIPHRDLTYRVMVPVSVRDKSARMTFGNQVAAMFVDLPVGPMPAHRRLAVVSAAMRRLKEQHQELATEELITMTSWAPATLHALTGPLLLEHQRFINFVVSNVPGVQQPLFTGGARLLETYPLLPVTMQIGMNVCVTSYCGGLYFGLVGDRELVPDLDILAAGIGRGVERLEAGIAGPVAAREVVAGVVA